MTKTRGSVPAIILSDPAADATKRKQADSQSLQDTSTTQRICAMPNTEEPNNNAVVAGAAVVGGTAGVVLAGPVIGLAAAGGAAYAATRSDGVGDAAKATGTAALAVGDKAREFNAEHDVTNKAARAAQVSSCIQYIRLPT